MTKRTNKPKAAPTTSQNTTKQPVEAIKQESNTEVAKKSKASTNASQKASTGGRRGRPKKVAPVEQKKEPVAVELVQDSVGKVVAQEARPYVSASNALPSKWEQVKAWLTYKLHQITFPFRGY